MEKKQRLYVYGTLKKGFYWHKQYLGGDWADYIGPATASPEFSLYISDLPYLVKEPTSEPVKGEIYMTDMETIENIDLLEGHPFAYRREVISIFDENGKELTAWAYVYPNVFRDKRSAFKESEYE